MSIFILIGVGTILGLTACYILIQIYLAKYCYTSSFYWRQMPVLSKTSLWIAHHPLIDLGLGGLRMAVIARFTFKQWLKAFRHVSLFIRLKKILDGFDDLIDSSSPDDVVAKGQIKLGQTPSLFLQKLLQQNGFTQLEKIIDPKLIAHAELYSFGNLLTVKLYHQAMLTLEYDKTTESSQKSLLRVSIAKENLEIAGTFRALFVHLIQQDARISAIDELTYEQLKKIYPAATRAGELLQMLHDTPEFRFDLLQEQQINKISANYFLAELERSNVLESVKASLVELPKRTVNFYELPEEIQSTFLRTQQLFVREAFHINRFAGWIYSLSWEYEYRTGFYIEKM